MLHVDVQFRSLLFWWKRQRLPGHSLGPCWLPGGRRHWVGDPRSIIWDYFNAGTNLQPSKHMWLVFGDNIFVHFREQFEFYRQGATGEIYAMLFKWEKIENAAHSINSIQHSTFSLWSLQGAKTVSWKMSGILLRELKSQNMTLFYFFQTQDDKFMSLMAQYSPDSDMMATYSTWTVHWSAEYYFFQ